MPRKIYPCSPEHPYHVTARTNNREWFGLHLKDVWRIFEDQLFFIHHAFGTRIHAFVLMSNHYHLILSDPYLNKSQALRWLMTETSREIGRRTGRINHIYGQRNYQCLIDSYHYYMHAYKYLYRNPVEAKACELAHKYPYSTLHGLLGSSKLIIPTYQDSLLEDDLSGTVAWLNQSVEDADWKSVRNALKKGKFQLAKEKFTNKESRLENQRL